MVLLKIGVLDATTAALVENAKVSVDKPHPYGSAQATTNRDGECEVWTAPGRNRILVEHDNYQSKSEVIDAPDVPEHPVTIDLTPKPKVSKGREAFKKSAKEAWQKKGLGGVKPSSAGVWGFLGENVIEISIALAAALTGYFVFFKSLPGVWWFALPIAVFFITVFSAHGKGPWRTVLYCIIILLLTWMAYSFIHAMASGAIYNMDWWLSKLNFLHWLGIPTSYIENFKDGVTNVLSFLNLKATQQPKPQAEKIGGYQALEVKFGSKYSTPQYTPPTLYANDSYSLPATVANSNPSNSGINIDNFYIYDIKMTNKTFKLMCGNEDNCNKSKPCSIDAGREEQITIDFNDGVKCQLPSTFVTLEEIFDKESDCSSKCVDLGFKFKTLTKDKDCVCEKIRDKNNVTELCNSDQFGDTAKIDFYTAFDFNVSGNSEFKLVQKESDANLLTKPKITTSTGPLSVTIYFVPDYISLEKKRGVKMFVSISNKGGGRADLGEIEIPSLESQVKFNPTDIETCKKKIKDIRIVNNEEEKDVRCDMSFVEPISFSGAYVTIPTNIQIKYTYNKVESTTLPINTDFCET